VMGKSQVIDMVGCAASRCRVDGLIKPVLVEREQWELRPLEASVPFFGGGRREM
jgi:hypothetical protein